MNCCIGVRNYREHGNSHLMTIFVAGYSRNIIIGPHWWGVLCTVFVILFGTASNMSIVHRLKSDYLKYLLTFFVYSCSAVVHILLLLTATTNPGIVFPSDDEESIPVLGRTATATYDQYDDDNRGHGSNWCDICEVEQSRERKIRHCDSCGYCIAKLDHHCPWMGQCVGQGNMKWFILFNVGWIVFFIEYVILAAVYIF